MAASLFHTHAQEKGKNHTKVPGKVALNSLPWKLPDRNVHNTPSWPGQKEMGGHLAIPLPWAPEHSHGHPLCPILNFPEVYPPRNVFRQLFLVPHLNSSGDGSSLTEHHE